MEYQGNEGKTIPWVRGTFFLNDRVVELSTVEVHVFSDSVLWFGGRLSEYHDLWCLGEKFDAFCAISGVM